LNKYLSRDKKLFPVMKADHVMFEFLFAQNYNHNSADVERSIIQYTLLKYKKRLRIYWLGLEQHIKYYLMPRFQL